MYTIEEEKLSNGEESLSLVQTPLEIFALQSNKVVLLDHQTDLFLWIGRNVPPAVASIQKAKCYEFIQQITKERFPHPQVQEFKEGTSMARWIQCRLNPSHKDSPQEQLISFPLLANLTTEQIHLFVKRYPKTDDLSFFQYYRSIFSSSLFQK